jgi:hypothetical protein
MRALLRFVVNTLLCLLVMTIAMAAGLLAAHGPPWPSLVDVAGGLAIAPPLILLPLLLSPILTTVALLSARTRYRRGILVGTAAVLAGAPAVYLFDTPVIGIALALGGALYAALFALPARKVIEVSDASA